LTESAYVAARDAALKKSTTPAASRRRGHFVSPLLLVLLILIAVTWYFAGTRNTTRLIATAVHAPITLEDEVQNLPAALWKAVLLNLPYAGTLDINLQVVRGNPVDVFLTPPDQLEAMNKGNWTNVRIYGDFSATKTETYRRSGRLGQGNYYLVIRDTSLGILSSRASDVSVKVQLNP
jgi:hypothetical protein